MKKLLTLLMAALLLLSLPLSCVQADGEEPAAEPPAVEPAPAADPEPEPAPAPAAEPEPAPAPAAEPEPAPAPAAEPEPAPAADPEPEPAPAADPEPAPAPATDPEPAPAPAADPEPAPAPAADPEPAPAVDPEPEPAPAADPEPEPTAEPEPEPTAEPAPHDKPLKEKSLAYWEQVELPSLKLTGNFREDVLTVARSQLGYSADKTCYEETASGRKRYYTRYGAWDGATFSDWCDSFVSFCVCYAGKGSYPKEASCGRHMFLLKAAGYWREWNSYLPQPGDLVFFQFNEGSLAPNHVAIVEQVIPGEGNEPGKLITIEGNLPNPNGGLECVRRMTRSLDHVVGYGTYTAGKVYPADYTIRSDGWEIIGEDSVYFVEYPKEEVLRFLGLYGSWYYDHWFPEAAQGPTEGAPGPETEGKE